MKRIAVDLAKSVYQVAESVRFGQVVQRKRLNREAFRRYIQEQAEPVEWVMEACGTAHYWGRLAQSLGHHPPVRYRAQELAVQRHAQGRHGQRADL